jgi:hypothetical protein
MLLYYKSPEISQALISNFLKVGAITTKCRNMISRNDTERSIAHTRPLGIAKCSRRRHEDPTSYNNKKVMGDFDVDIEYVDILRDIALFRDIEYQRPLHSVRSPKC